MSTVTELAAPTEPTAEPEPVSPGWASRLLDLAAAHPLTCAFYAVAWPVMVAGLAQTGMAWT